MNKILPILKYLIGWPLSFISLFFIFKLIYTNLFSLQSLEKINLLFLLLGIGFFLFYFFLRSVLWHEIIKEKGNNLPFKKATYFWEISEIKRYTPGNIWSFLSRTKLFTKDNMSTQNMVYSLFNETILIILGCFLASVFYISYLFNSSLINYFLIIISFLSIAMYVFAHKINERIKLKGFFEKIKPLIPDSNYNHNFKLYFLSFAAFFMFGTATYFSSVAVFYLNPTNILQIISLSVFSLLIGYLSVVTPMGLGVREGVMTLGLSHFIALSPAAFIAIFTRIIFILSEVIFLIIVSFINKVKIDFLDKLIILLKRYKYESALFVSSLLYFLYYTTASFLRYDNFYTGRFDLGNMDQTVWNSMQGRFFQITDPNGTDIISRLSFHADFILILISPLYLIWESPKMLLLLQSVILGLGTIFIFLISKNVLKNKNISLVFSFVYLINPALGYTNLYDFHPVTLGTTFLLGSFYFLLKRKYFIFILFGILAGLTKEQVWSTVAFLGITISIREILENKLKLNSLNKNQLKNIFLGVIFFVTSISIFYYLIWQAIPNARGGNHFALEYYSEFGSSASEVAKNIILNPLKTLSTIFQKDQLNYLQQLLSPLGFLPLISPFILLFAASDLSINLLSSNPQLHQIYYQYTASVTPFLFISSIYSVYFLKKYFPKININIICLYLITTALISAYLIGPLPGSKRPNIDMFAKQLPNALEIENFLSNIPKEKSVAATNNLGSHLSQREYIFTIPIGIEKADYVLFLLNDAFAKPSLDAQKQMAKNMEKDKNYIQIYKNGNFIVFEKRNL